MITNSLGQSQKPERLNRPLSFIVDDELIQRRVERKFYTIADLSIRCNRFINKHL